MSLLLQKVELRSTSYSVIALFAAALTVVLIILLIQQADRRHIRTVAPDGQTDSCWLDGSGDGRAGRHRRCKNNQRGRLVWTGADKERQTEQRRGGRHKAASRRPTLSLSYQPSVSEAKLLQFRTHCFHINPFIVI